MKIYIEYNITKKAHGGGNQFLRSLKKEFVNLGLYTDDVAKCDIVLFNSHHNIERLYNLKKKYPNKMYIHRIDGPMRLYNQMNDTRDDIVYNLNQKIATATVFQSLWSMKKNFELGMRDNKPRAVIQNSVDSGIFNQKYEKEPNDKIRLISTSFSSNYRKGHKYYQFLDSHLNFDKYEYVFVGNSPVKYKNIKQAGCLDSCGVAERLRKSDIYITGSENDPCSNSLMEAAACGLKILALNSGGHPEILKNEKCLFDSEEELLKKLVNHDSLTRSCEIASMEEVVNKYLYFLKKIIENERN